MLQKNAHSRFSQRLGAIRSHDELFTHVVRDNNGKILLQPNASDLSVFRFYSGPGFARTEACPPAVWVFVVPAQRRPLEYRRSVKQPRLRQTAAARRCVMSDESL